MNDVACRLALGTVQLGMAYGIANRTGQPNADAARDIIGAAWKAGVRFFDTAQAYGSSEQVLGRALSALGTAGEAKVITKLDPQLDASAHDAVRSSLRRSLERLGVPRLWGVMLHREEQLGEWDQGLGAQLAKAREGGLVEHAGASVYSVERARQTLRTPGADLLQVAANVFDRRMIRAGVFDPAADAGKTVFVRSIYLQGLALMDPGAVPARLGRAREAVARFAGFCARRNVSRGRFAVGYVLRRARGAVLVVGAESAEQARESIGFFEAPPLPPEWLDEWDAEWPDDDESFINPQQWPAK